MTKEQYEMLRKKEGYQALYIDLLNASGFAGCLPDGNIVDRRYHPDAVPVAKNSLFGVEGPKKMRVPTNKEYVFKTVGDIVDFVTEENIDDFLIDLKLMLLDSKRSVDLIKYLPAENKINSANDVLVALSWIDDGEHENGFKGCRVTDGESTYEITAKKID